MFPVCLEVGMKFRIKLKKSSALNNMEVTEDMRFSLEEVECMGSCGTAPMIAVNEDYYENLDKEKSRSNIRIFKK